MRPMQGSDGDSCALQVLELRGFHGNPSILKAMQTWRSHAMKGDLQLLLMILTLRQSKAFSYFQP